MKIYAVIKDIDDYPECGGGESTDAVFLNYANAEKYATEQKIEANARDIHNIYWRVETWETADEKESEEMNEELLMEVGRMLREREDYYEKEWQKAENAKQGISAAMMLGKSIAYNSARQMLMAALTDNKEILREYDQYHEEKED